MRPILGPPIPGVNEEGASMNSPDEHALGRNHSGRNGDPATTRRRIRVALDLEPGDLLITGGQVVNVFNRRVEPADVVIADGRIAGVGCYSWRASQTLSASGRVIVPGLIDAHMHLESTLLTPVELAKLIVPMGTTAVISDSHEVGNVMGVRGIDMLASACEGLPLDLFFMASSCVPATAWEDAGASLGPAEVKTLLSRAHVLGLAEVMDIPAVLAGAQDVLEKVETALLAGRVVDGHAAGLSGRELIAYAATGIRSDHESTTVEEARARCALGMLVQVREGSSAQNLDALLPLLAAGELDDSWCLVTDDIFPDDLRRLGHLDGLLRRVVAGGVAPAAAIRHATYVPARHYGLVDRGAVAPGYCADLVLVENLKDFRVDTVIKDGKVAARDGKCVDFGPAPRLDRENTVHLAALDERAFCVPLSGETCSVIEIVPDQIITRRTSRSVRRVDGLWAFDPERDVLMIASIERHRASGRIGLGLVSGFGLTREGALGSSVAHDSHNLVIAGTNPRDMLVCARAMAEQGGGFVAAASGHVQAILPLPIAGLLSDSDADQVCRQLKEVNHAAHELGCPLDAPFGTLSFLALPVIPELRITTQGVFDVLEQKFLKL
jgi:adenine deaminase